LVTVRRWAIFVLAVVTGLLLALLIYNRLGTDMGHQEEMVGMPGEEPFRGFSNLTGLPDEQLWETYRFALANPQRVLDYVPCYCGCRNHGDKNNRDCFINAVRPDGKIVYDFHGSG